MLNNLLSNNVEMMYCIECERNDMILETTSGKKFHLVGHVHENMVEPVECRGPFVYSEPEQMKDPDFEFTHFPILLPHFQYFEETDIEQLATLTFEDKYFPSLQEILIDNIRPGDISLFNPYLQ